MFFRSIISSVVCALVLMGWGYFYWVVIHPPGGGMLPLPREEGLSMFFLETIPSSGVYVFPSIKGESPKDDGHDMEDYQARHSLGPTGILMFSREGSDPYSYEKLLRGFLQYFTASLLAALLLIFTEQHLLGFFRRWLVVLLLGVFTVASIRMGDAIWWNHPFDYMVQLSIFSLTQWAVGGVVLALLVRPSRRMRVSDQSLPLWKRARY